MRAHDSLFATAARLPDKIAVVDGPRRLSYADLVRAARSLAGGLQARGVARGDRVVIFLPNGADLVIATLGVLEAGAVLVPVHPQMKATKLAYILTDTNARA